MANKRYDEFGAGTPVGTNIILFADPATGALSKVALEDIAVIPQYCAFSVSQLVNANNDGTDPQDIATVTIPAAIFDVIGRFIEITVVGETLVTTGPPIGRLRIAGNDAAPLALSSAGYFEFKAQVQRISTTNFKYYQYNTRVLTNAGVSGTTNVALAQGNDLVCVFRITAAAVANRVFVLGMNAKVFEV
jgi:hypothetical protein